MAEQGADKPEAGISGTYVSILSHVIPLLDQIKGTIEESARRIPGASTQLQSVTRDTESATIEILNVLDTMAGQISAAESELAVIEKMQTERHAVFQRFASLLKALTQGGAHSREAAQLEESWGELVRTADTDEPVAALGDLLTRTKQHTMDIAMALQVQDITAQRIAGVLHLIESIREQLRWILQHLSDGTQSEPPVPPDGMPGRESSQKSFDIDAQFTSSKERQNSADEIVQQWNMRSHEHP